MKISEIRIDRTKSLGNYENIKLGLTAVVSDDENATDAIENLKTLVDWEINKEERTANLQKFNAELENPELPAERRAVLANWLSRFNELKTKVEGFSKTGGLQ